MAVVYKGVRGYTNLKNLVIFLGLYPLTGGNGWYIIRATNVQFLYFLHF